MFPEWKGGRVVECAGLEIRYTVIPYRGFKSHPFRHKSTGYINLLRARLLIRISVILILMSR